MHHLQGAGDPCGVCWRKPGGGCGVQLLQRVVGLGHGQGTHGSADRRTNIRHRRDAIDQRAQIQARSSDQDRQFPDGMGRRDFATGIVRPSCCRTTFRAINIAEQPMWHPRLIGSTGAR